MDFGKSNYKKIENYALSCSPMNMELIDLPI